MTDFTWSLNSQTTNISKGSDADFLASHSQQAVQNIDILKTIMLLFQTVFQPAHCRLKWVSSLLSQHTTVEFVPNNRSVQTCYEDVHSRLCCCLSRFPSKFPSPPTALQSLYHSMLLFSGTLWWLRIILHNTHTHTTIKQHKTPVHTRCMRSLVFVTIHL